MVVESLRPHSKFTFNLYIFLISNYRLHLLVQISDSGQVRVDDDGRLIIERVEKENSGNYTCAAENIAGKTEWTMNLVVTSKFVEPT